MTTLFIGDVHGKTDQYAHLLEIYKDQVDQTIQLGDFGFAKQHIWHHENIDPTKHKVLFGNHDDPHYLRASHSLGDFGVYQDFFFIRGADSIDKHHRVAYKTWWPEEELNWKQWNDCIKLYEETKPRIIISHDCPESLKIEKFGYHTQSFTNRGLQECFERHQPDFWFFGHYHQSIIKTIENTTFICLDELEVYKFEH
jgi:predicted phosphodiesterase